jgi:cation diffusion facilitator CzcD-associated flavoprotein CzcO
MKEKTPLLIVGAGPFGLSLAAYLKDNNIEHIYLSNSFRFFVKRFIKDI